MWSKNRLGRNLLIARFVGNQMGCQNYWHLRGGDRIITIVSATKDDKGMTLSGCSVDD